LLLKKCFAPREEERVSVADYMASNSRTTGELGRTWKNGIIIYYLDICPEELRTTTKPSLRNAGVSAEIRTEDLPDTNLERYHYINMLGRCGLLGSGCYPCNRP
jgi:hypothetical protein